MKIRNAFYCFISVFALIAVILSLSGCSMAGLEWDEYSSVFVDSQSESNDIEFELVLAPDRTFVLTRYDGEEATFCYEGEYRTSTVRGRTEIICTVDEGFSGNYNPYFTVRYLDDGGVAAFAEGNASAFGRGAEYEITMVIFR